MVVIMDKTMNLMKKNVVMLDENSDGLENIIESLEWLVKRESTSSFDKAELRGNIKRLLAINDVIIHLVGDDLVHIVENDTDYHESKKKVGVNKEIESMLEKYKDWLLDADLNNLKSKEDTQSKPPITNIPPEVCFKLGELIGSMSRLSTSLNSMDTKDGVTLKTMITMELAILEKTAMNIAQELFHPKK